jgi:probable DNA metabolism protein
MQPVVYDESFEGFLTAIFDVYEYKFLNVCIIRQSQFQKNMFGTEHFVTSSATKADRVWKGLQQRLSSRALTQLYRTFLSEINQTEDILLSYIRYAFSSKNSIEYDYSNPTVLYVTQTAIKVEREKHRMEAFVRFQLTKDQLYYATIQPDYDVLPLISKHFADRYADQRWLIYDIQRRYGIYYDLNTVETIEMAFSEETDNGKNVTTILDEQEQIYQQLWQQYFNSVNIAARKNMKLHIRHMPKRYWRHLIEKKPSSR